MSTVWGIEGRAEYTPLAEEEEGGVGQDAALHRGSSAAEGARSALDVLSSPAGAIYVRAATTSAVAPLVTCDGPIGYL